MNIQENAELLQILQNDFLTIKQKILHDLEHSSDKFIHTSNGQYIQIRSKDAKRANGQYNPIYSNHLNRYISNKNHAFYFKKNFMMDIQRSIIQATKIE